MTDATDQTDKREEREVLEGAVQEVIAAYRKQGFRQTDINDDPESEAKYEAFRGRHGEKPTKQQIEELNKEIGSLNCSLVADWQIADIEASNPEIQGTKILTFNRGPLSSNPEPEKVQTVNHAIPRLVLGETTIYYEPANGQIFEDLEEAQSYYSQIWPQPSGFSFVFAEAY